jgi:carboxylesterase type B
MSDGAWGNNGQVPSLEEARKIGPQMQQALNAKSLEEMRNVPAHRILNLQEEFEVGVNGGGPIRIVGANVDGYFLPQTPAQIFAARKLHDVPVIADSRMMKFQCVKDRPKRGGIPAGRS